VCVAARLFAAIRVFRTNSALFGTALHALLHRWNSRPGVPPLPCPYWPIHFSTGHTITPTILPSLWGPVTREPYIQTNSLSLPSWRDKTPGKTWPWNQTRPSLLLFCESQTFVTYFILAFFYLIGIAQESFFFPKKAWCLSSTQSFLHSLIGFYAPMIPVS
jgi:hypothetical protein